MISEPLAGRHETVVTETRTAENFAEMLQACIQLLYLRAEIQIDIMSHQVLAKPLAYIDRFKENVHIGTIK